MSRYVFDLECDGFLDEATRIHCLALKDIDTGEVFAYTPDKVVDGLKRLQDADLMVGHNVIKFDLPVIQKLNPWFHYDEAKVLDTLTLSRLIHADLYDADEGAKFSHRVEGKLMGSHSLKAWGIRLGLHKGDYDGGFDTFSQEMLDYNVQDVEVTERLYREFNRYSVDPRAIQLEHQVAFIVARQERHGVYFDVEKAQQLTATLQKRRLELEAELETTFAPWFKRGDVVIPKVPNKERGTWGWYEDTGEKLKSGKPKLKFHGYPYSEVKLTIFNPGSRHHIADRLKALYGWEPKEFTDKGQPKIDETVLSKLPYPEAQLLGSYFLVQKRLGMVAEGDNAWLKLVTKEGKIHGSVNTNGAVTGRCTHQAPNLAQVPAVGAPYGEECRELFRAKPGLAQVGIDVSGLELRMLAHFMARWDNGAYGKVVCEGDIHSVNQEAAGLATRAQAKTFLYGWLYGAGAEKIGAIVGKGSKEGNALKKRFLQRTPGLEQLISAVQKAASKGYLVGLDGRHLRVRSSHAALNTLLQSAGALICKRWVVELDQEIRKRNLRANQLLFIHDEVQMEVVKEEAEQLGEIAIECIKRAGGYFGIRVPLTGEFKIGTNWKSCH